ncbi:AMP-binding protein [Metabacillus halosaccharovorans]|nr:AMP-binding protein [Metabacillus halosaccharovorans]
MSPMDFLQKPYRWLEAISKYKATVSGAPNFAYELCVKKVSEEQKNQIDLSSWRVAFNGAEPIRYETLENFSSAFKVCGFKENSFYPCYGMAEATLLISGGNSNDYPIIKNFDSQSLKNNKVQESIETRESSVIVSCGKTSMDQEIKIVNPETNNLCSENEVGEIWVNGQNVAKGYFGTGDNENFNGLINGNNTKKYLKTGDLGFIHEGQLYITGRLKDVIILRGKNYYPQDIELTTEKAHIGVREGCSASFSITKDNEEKLVIVAEVERTYRPRGSNQQNEKLDDNNILKSIRKKVMEDHSVQPYYICLIKTGSIPKTSSGKIQRNACKHEFLNDELEIWYTDKKE